MPRRVTISEKQTFAKFLENHPDIEQFDLDQAEYEEICAVLKWNPIAIKKQKSVNIDNANNLLHEYKQSKNQRESEEQDSENCDEQHQANQEDMNENCSCNICIIRQKWNGKRKYKYTDYNFEKQSYVVEFSQENWKTFTRLDKNGNYMLSNGYGGLITREMRKTGCSCKDIATKTNFWLASNALQILAYCTWGTETPCNLFKLVYSVNSPECNSANGLKIFEVFATTLPLKHCENSYKVPQIRGFQRDTIKEDLRMQMPKPYGEYLIINYGDRKFVTPKEKWPLSQKTISKIRSEILNYHKIAESSIESLMIMWTCENRMPKYLAEPTTDFSKMTYERSDTFYDLDRINSTIERMLVLIRQLSGVCRLGESGRSMSVELQLLNAIDDRGYQLQELQDAVEYLFSQFRKIYLVNKDLYVQLNKRGGRVFELEKQFREQGASKCLYYMADVIKYEPSLLAMQRVLDRTMREIRIFRKQRNKHKLELCVSHIRNENFDKAYDEFVSFEDNIEQLQQIVETVFEGSSSNLIKLLLFLRGYFSMQKPNSEETFVTGCEHIVQYLKCSVMFCRVETLMIYSAINKVLSERCHLEDFFRDRLELLLVDLSGNKELAVQLIQTDPDEAGHFAKLFNYMSDELLLELVREAYQGSNQNLRYTLKFISNLPCINQQIISQQEVHNEMRRLGLSKSSSIFVLAYHIKRTMLHPKFPQASRSTELDDLKAILPPNIVGIVWKQVSISRYESRILMKCGAVGKEVGFSRYTADKNRFECEPIDDGEAFRIRAVAVHGYLVEEDGRLEIVPSKYDATCPSSHWRLIPYEDCNYFRIENVASSRCLYSKFSESVEYDFYNSPEVLRSTAEESLLSESNSYWKVCEFTRGPRGDADCAIL